MVSATTPNCFYERKKFLEDKRSFLHIGNQCPIHQLTSSDYSEEDTFDDVLFSGPCLDLTPNLVVTIFWVT